MPAANTTDRIADSFARARREGRAAFVAYLVYNHTLLGFRMKAVGGSCSSWAS